MTIPRDLDRAAHDLVGEREFSALVVRGIEREIQARRIDQLIAEYEDKHGDISAAEMESVWRRALDQK